MYESCRKKVVLKSRISAAYAVCVHFVSADAQPVPGLMAAKEFTKFSGKMRRAVQ